jgi:hypothetical protein
MTHDQILLLFFGLPLAILGLGLRRALGRKMLLVLLGGAVAGVFGLVLETALVRAGHGLALPLAPGQSLGRSEGLFCLAAALLGALGAVLLRYRGRGMAP